MTAEDRKAVDAACLRLLGWKPLHWFASPGGGGAAWYASPPGDGAKGHICPQPSRDPALIGPLAEALLGKGWNYEMRSFTDPVTGKSTRIAHLTLSAGLAPPHGRHAYEEADTLPEALAKAAARAVGEAP